MSTDTANGGKFLKIAERFGVPSAVTLLLFLFGSGASYWMATNIVKPWSERHLQFVDSVDKSNGKLSDTVKKQADLEERRTRVMEENARLMESLEQNQKLMIELYREQRNDRKGSH